MKKFFDIFIKYLLIAFVFFLPFHAVAITFLQCRLYLPTDIIRFWKELIIVFLLLVIKIQLIKKYKFNFEAILKNNYVVGLSITFIILSFIYVFFPYLTIKTHALLGFKYDVFFIFTLLIGLYLAQVQKYFFTLVKTLFVSTFIVLITFVPWYLTGGISQKAEMLGYSDKVSTYQAGECLAYAQNVTGGHNRLQASFGDPIRFSVFTVIVFILFLGYVIEFVENRKKQIFLMAIASILSLTGIFYAFTKTSILGFVFAGAVFFYTSFKVIYQKNLGKRFIIGVIATFSSILGFLLYVKRDLFLHPEAILGRAENLVTSVQMFLWNPLGYGLGVAGPASQLATSPNKGLSDGVQKFLPENWYVQIFLEQGFIGGIIFLALIIVIGKELFQIAKKKRDFFSVSLFTAYVSLCFMANFTHVFEEGATNFILFLLIGGYIAKESKWFKN